MMVGGRTYVPLRFTSEAMGDKVEFRHPSNSSVVKSTVYINCTNLPVETPKKLLNPKEVTKSLNEAITNQSEWKAVIDKIGTSPKVVYQNLPEKLKMQS